MKTKQFRIRVKSGNFWYLQPFLEGVDIASANFGDRERSSVAVNRVGYSARGVFTLCPKNHWDPLALSAHRVDNFKSPTASARAKIHAEMIEAMTIYSRRYAAEMHHQYCKALRIMADALRSEATGLERRTADRVYDMRADANTLQTLGADALKACGRELDRRSKACTVDRPVRSASY